MGVIRQDVALPKPWPAPRDAADVAASLSAIRRRDPVGHRVHLILAGLFALSLAVAPAVSAVAYALLFIYALIRLPNTWRCYSPLIRLPALWLAAAWVLVTAMSLVWSSNPAQGVDELSAARVLLVPLLLWPVMEHAAWLVGAFLVGVLIQNGIQLLQLIDLTPTDPGDPSTRHRGLLHPIQTGAVSAAALCWLTSVVLYARGRWRWLALLAAALAAVGLLASGSRGPWLAAGVAVPLCVLAALVRRQRAIRPAIALLVVGVAAAGAVWPIAGDAIGARLNDAGEEWRHAVQDAHYDSSVGGRIGMWRWAWTLFAEHPIIGVGAGAYYDQATALPEYQQLVAQRPGIERFTKDHAHSTYIHALATTGVIGATLLLAVLIAVVMQAWPMRADEWWSHATIFVLLTWLIGTQFDCYHLNSQLFGVFALVMTFTIPFRPAVKKLRWRLDDDSDIDDAKRSVQTGNQPGAPEPSVTKNQ